MEATAFTGWIFSSTFKTRLSERTRTLTPGVSVSVRTTIPRNQVCLDLYRLETI
jgi:hypothetical protein